MRHYKNVANSSFYKDLEKEVRKGMVGRATSKKIDKCGKYSVEVRTYETSYGVEWIKVNIKEGKEIVFKVVSDSDSFVYSWVLDHPDGDDYIVFGEIIGSYAVANLTARTKRVFYPEFTSEGCRYEWLDVRPSSDKTKLVTVGVLWENLYEIVFYDFSRPVVFPLPTLKTKKDIYIPLGYNFEEIVEWEGELLIKTNYGASENSDIPFEQFTEAEKVEYVAEVERERSLCGDSSDEDPSFFSKVWKGERSGLHLVEKTKELRFTPNFK